MTRSWLLDNVAGMNFCQGGGKQAFAATARLCLVSSASRHYQNSHWCLINQHGARKVCISRSGSLYQDQFLKVQFHPDRRSSSALWICLCGGALVATSFSQQVFPKHLNHACFRLSGSEASGHFFLCRLNMLLHQADSGINITSAAGGEDGLVVLVRTRETAGFAHE